MLVSAETSFADTITCKNGSVVVGTITEIDGGIVSVKNDVDNAGETKIKQSEIVSISTDSPLFVRTPDGKTLKGKSVPAAGAPGTIVVADETGAQTRVAVADISNSWLLDGKSPEQREAEKYDYHWSYEAGASLLGHTGNSESVSGGVNVSATLKNEDNALLLYAKYNYGKAKDSSTGEWVKSADNFHTGFDFSSQFYAPWFWYARSDNGFDRVQNIKFFDVSAAGFGWNIIKEDDWNFSLRGGLSYRYESYEDYMDTIDGAVPSDMNTTGLEFGLHHDYSWDWGKIVTDITYTPGFDDFTGNYFIVHETYAEMNLKTIDNLYFRVGVRNEYRSETTANEHLDTTYYAQLVFSWK